MKPKHLKKLSMEEDRAKHFHGISLSVTLTALFRCGTIFKGKETVVTTKK